MRSCTRGRRQRRTGCHRTGCRCLAAWLLVVWLAPLLLVCARPLLKRLIRWLCRTEAGRDGGALSAGGTRPATGEKQTIPGIIYRRPDPMIYDQYYLQSQGLAVTWDNPDIHLERPRGTPVSSHDLEPGTDYYVISRIWNLSEKAPAPRLPVQFSYLDFGVGTTKTTFAETQVNLPVKGSPRLPVFAEVVWSTPSAPGHYCLQVELLWPAQEDENPDNNLGQENTDVRAPHSPATFQFPVRNDRLSRARDVRLVADSYAIPPLPSCAERDTAAARDDSPVRRREGASRHDPALFPVPVGWQVEITPTAFALGPGREQLVTVTVTAPGGFEGRQPFNVNAFDGDELFGGVTLYVEAA